MTKQLVLIGATLAVIVPIFVHIQNVSWSSSSLIVNIFPIFGLLAFTLLWLHAISGAFWEWLCSHFGVETMEEFIGWTALAIFISIVLHPLLLLFLVKFDLPSLISHSPVPIYLGIFGLLLLLTYDIGKVLKKYKILLNNWNSILIISNIGFILTFFHSLLIGSDLQIGFLRNLWIFYGVSAILAITYTYGVKRFLRQI